MVEAELLIGQLRAQVRTLQGLLNYLEGRPMIKSDDYAYSHTTLRELITHLKSLEQFSSQRGSIHRLRAEWLN